MDRPLSDADDAAGIHALEVVELIDLEVHAPYAAECLAHLLHEALGIDVAPGGVAQVAHEVDGVGELAVIRAEGPPRVSGIGGRDDEACRLVLGVRLVGGEGVAPELGPHGDVGGGRGHVRVEAVDEEGRRFAGLQALGGVPAEVVQTARLQSVFARTDDGEALVGAGRMDGEGLAHLRLERGGGDRLAEPIRGLVVKSREGVVIAVVHDHDMICRQARCTREGYVGIGHCGCGERRGGGEGEGESEGFHGVSPFACV